MAITSCRTQCCSWRIGVKRNGEAKASAHFEKKDDAAKIGRELSRNAGSELVIHEKDDRIQQKDSHISDPSPPRNRN